MKKILLVLLFAATLLLAACGQDPGGSSATDTQESASTGDIVEIPDDDALAPTEYSGSENLAFIAGVFSECDNYRAVTTGVAVAEVKGSSHYQTIFDSREFFDGKLMMLSTSKSDFVSVAEEKYFEENRVLIRRQTEKESIDGEHTAFFGEPGYMTIDEYRASYGEIPRGVSDFSINRETILSTGKLGWDGENYYLTVSLDPVKSTAACRKNIATLMGTADLPTYLSVKVTFFFNERWQVTRTRVNETYAVEKFGMTCASDLVTYFYYGAAKNDLADFYAAYENKNLNGFVRAKTGGDYVAEAFSGARTGAFKVTASSGGDSAEAYAVRSGDGIFLNFGGTNAYYTDDKLYFVAGGKNYCLDAFALSDAFLSEDVGFKDIIESADFKTIFSAAAEGFEFTSGGAGASLSLDLGGVSATVALTFDISGGAARLSGLTANLSLGGGYGISAESCDFPGAVAVPDTVGATDITASAISVAESLKGSVFSADFGAELELAGKPITCEKGRFSYNKENGNYVFRANFIKDEFTYRVRFTSLENAAYLVVDDDKYVLGGTDRIRIKEFFDELTGGILGEIKEKSPLFAALNILRGTDPATVDLKAFKGSQTVVLRPNRKYTMASDYFGLPVSASVAEMTFSGYSESMNVSGVSGYDRLDDITELLLAAGKTYSEATDDNGDTAIKISGQITLLLGMEEITLSPILIDVTAEIAMRGGETEGYIKLSYDYYFAGVGVIGVMIINGDTDTEIVIKNKELYIYRHQTTYGRSSLLRYVETACDYHEYRHVTVDYAKAHFSEILGFILNVGDTVQSVIDSMGQLSTQHKKFVLSEYLKDYSYSGGKFYLTLNGEGMMGGGAIGDLSAEITKSADGRMGRVTFSGALDESSSVTADLKLDNLTSAFTYSQAKTDINRVINAVASSGAVLQK